MQIKLTISPFKRRYILNYSSILQFVAHPNCQQHLKQIWTKDTEWTHNIHKSILVGCLFIFLPVAAFCYLLAPDSKVRGFALAFPLKRWLLNQSFGNTFAVKDIEKMIS